MGATTSLDTNWDPAERWGDGQLRGVLAFTDVLLPNEAEALGLSGASDLRDAVRALTAAGPKVVVKLGSRGALSADGSDWHEVGPPGDLAGPFIDAIGAGDCCNAGVIAGLLRGMNLAAAAGLGCAVGSASTSRSGRHRRPYHHDDRAGPGPDSRSYALRLTLARGRAKFGW